MVGLPQKVTDCILTHCRHDIRSLHRFSLVSRSWCTSARRWLFYSVKVDSCSSPYDNDISPVDAFIRFISFTPDIAQFVRVLDVNMTAQMEPISGIALGALLCRLPRLRSLGVYNSGFYGNLVMDGTSCRLNTLTLYNIWDGDGHLTLSRLLNLFPELRELYTEALSPLFAQVQEDDSTPWFHLSTLSLLEPTAQLLTSTSHMVASCEALEMTLSDSVSRQTRAFINTIAPSIVDLQLIVSSSAAHMDDIPFDACTSLRTLTLLEPPSRWSTPSWTLALQPSPLPALPALLRRLPPSVERVRISLARALVGAHADQVRPLLDAGKRARLAVGPVVRGDPRGALDAHGAERLQAGVVKWQAPVRCASFWYAPWVGWPTVLP
ncbi:hypothetical protein PHLGIDRAFT_117654 [Phlebiopsis gigantea 11061_1 CR5-6]|uniref:F-box domain-containing protein n=1 Tax=Phlebiopsis gigantea (strain 11061_1 CR5-6) TaxID=745531 RepID=A0A0C3NS18_PHLG1|nr:hypothetical protein PHLGIDRAFT_117654 [Phlebiopsis gigantea 11061_1 CR5-6]